MTSQQHADNVLQLWQLQAKLGIKPADRRFDEQLQAIRSILDDFDHNRDLRKHELRVVS